MPIAIPRRACHRFRLVRLRESHTWLGVACAREYGRPRWATIRVTLPRFEHNTRPTSAMDRAIDTAAAGQMAVCGIYNCRNTLLRYVADEELQRSGID